MQRLKSAYDTEIRYLDGELGRLLDALERHPRFDEMLVLITSDHGEGFGEHGFCDHGSALYEEMIRVPLFVKPARVKPNGAPAGASVPWLFQSVDVFPTALTAAGLSVPPGIDGIAWGASRTSCYAETWPGPILMRSLHLVGEDNLRLIVSSNGEKELHDLKSDPGQQKNVFVERAADAARLQAMLSELTSREPAPPTSGEGASEETIRSLRALGYLK